MGIGTIILVIVLILIAIIIIANISSKLIDKYDTKRQTQAVKIIAKESEIDVNNEERYYVTFELIDNTQLKLLVPQSMYEIAEVKSTGRLTFESLRFIQFVKSGRELIKENLFEKDYRLHIKKKA